MAYEEHLALLKQGVEVWNAWRNVNRDVRVNLTGADLRGAHLDGVYLEGAHLEGADLQWAYLEGAHLEGAHLEGADLQWAHLEGAYLRGSHLHGIHLRAASLRKSNLLGADLSGADLTGVDLHGAYLQETILQEAIFREADFEGADLEGAYLSDTIFANNDLGTVRGLEAVIHRGPSEISTSTLYKSGGKISEVFLRGCGVPDNLIEYLPSLTRTLQPIQFYSCFISYSTKDEAFAKRLHSRMQQEHLRVWFAPEELKGGHKLRDQIDDAIRLYDKLLLVLSDASMASDWVAHEVRRAYARERAEDRRVLFPIRLCDYESLAQWDLYDGGRDLALDVRHYYIPDFSTWKDHDAFEAAFARLLNDLKAVEAKG